MGAPAGPVAVARHRHRTEPVTPAPPAPPPSPGRGEVLVRVAVAGVDFGDLLKAHGTFRGGPQPPYVAGFEAIASLRHLPTRQRAILILREVLAFSAAETAEILGTTTVAVKSGLQGARARLGELEPEPEDLLEPTDPRARALLDGYIAAFERYDAGLLEHVLRTDATLEATPFRDWQAGRVHCIRMLDVHVLGSPGDWRMVATTANGQPAAAVYHRDADGALRADGIVVLSPTPTGVARVVAFHHDPALTVAFGLPDRLAE